MITLKMKPDQVKTCLQYLLNFNCFQDQVQMHIHIISENFVHSCSCSSPLFFSKFQPRFATWSAYLYHALLLFLPRLYVFMSHNFCSLPPVWFFFLNLSLTPSDMSLSIKFLHKSFITNLSCTLWKLNWMLFLWEPQNP